MGLRENKLALIDEFNASDDYGILLILAGNQTTDEDKKFLLENCYERITKMDIELILQTLRCVDLSFCQSCENFIKNIISHLAGSQIEDLLYRNKHYHDVNNIAHYLIEQEWFISSNKNKIFVLAYELEKFLKEEYVSEETTIDLGINIIETLTHTNNNPELFDMIMKNYLGLLKKHNKKFIEQFKIYGYEAMDKHLASDQEITPNLIIFDCEIMCLNNDTNVSFFEFYNSKNDKNKDAFAYAHAGVVRINVDAIKDVYAEYKNKMTATQIIFYVIGHEIDHIFCERYQSEEERNFYTELKVYNSGVAEALQNIVNREFYREWHDNFTHEYQANIAGIKTVYERYDYLKSIKIEDKIEMNRLFALLLRSSFCQIEHKDKSGYFAAVEFTRDEFAKYKDNLPGYAYHHLFNGQVEMSEELQEVENNLSEYERFMLGYYNKYMAIIDLIAKGEIKTTNIFADLPELYEKYKDTLKDNFPPFIKSEVDNKKIN